MPYSRVTTLQSKKNRLTLLTDRHMPVFTDKEMTFIGKSRGCLFFCTDKFHCWCYILHALFCKAVKQETVTFIADGSPVKRKQFPWDKISSSMVCDVYRTTQFASVGFHERDLE